MSATGTVTASSHELGDFSDAVARAYFPHRLLVKGRASGPADLRAVDLGPVRLARIGWGSEVSVESDHPGAWAVNVPRREGATVPSHQGSGSALGRPAKCIATSTWSAASTLTAKDAPSRYAAAFDFRVSATCTSGGSSEIGVNAVTVAPWCAPSGVRQVMTVTPVAKRPKVERRVSGSTGASFVVGLDGRDGR